jgi:flagellar hook-associated protein 3 FlgL
MRITQGRMIELAAASTAKAQSSAADAATQVSSGMRVGKASDDPTAWAAAERTKVQRAVIAGSSAAIDAGRGRLEETDAALSTIGDVVSRVRELAVQGSSATYNGSDRAQLAIEIRALMQSAVGAANTRSADGEYLLAGSDSLAQPFDATGAYTGDGLARALPTGATGITNAAVTGEDLTAASGVDVLSLLEQVAARFAANDPAGASALLGDLDTATKQVGMARSRTGSAMAVLDSTRNAHALLDENFAKEISRHVEIDTVAAASNFARTSQALEVSRSVTSFVIEMVKP